MNHTDAFTKEELNILLLSDQAVIIEEIYHGLQHVTTDLENRELDSVKYTVEHMMKKIEDLWQSHANVEAYVLR